MTDNNSILRKAASGRHSSEKRFRAYGIIAIMISLGFLFVMISSIVYRGQSAFTQHFVKLEITIPESEVNRDNLASSSLGGVLKEAMRQRFPDAETRAQKKDAYGLVSAIAEYSLVDAVVADPSIIGKKTDIWVRASTDIDVYLKGNINGALDESLRRVTDQQIGWVNQLKEAGQIESRFNSKFFTSGDSREPEQAGILGALIGSSYSLLVCFLLSFPLGVAAAVYLEEFAKKGRVSRLIEVNINNLAAVPSIVFGLLGLAILLNFIGLPRSTPLVGGAVLALMTLPTIIIASRASLRAVPPSIREAAQGLGANKLQVTFHHVVPLALPGMLTGAIIGMAQALGETAPLLMIGMVAFIADVPSSITDAATALPVQIFLWADSPERGFLEKTSAAIMVLLAFLIVMNLLAVILRRKLERRW